ncbi:MAG: hypothetical protein Q9159_002166 [Coniocarpon cinnabarinum]
MDFVIYLLALFGLLVVKAIITSVYRLTYHPLARVPGPKAAAITKWYEFYVDTLLDGGGKFAFEIDRLHRVYGPIVRITPNEVHVDDSEWLKTLFGGPGTIRDKDATLAHIVGNNLGTFGTVNHHLHRMRRSAVSPFFSKKSVSAIQPRIQTAVERLSQVLAEHQQSGSVFDARVTFLAWSTDSLTSYVFNESANLLDNPTKAIEWWEMYDKLRTLFPMLKQCLWIVPLALELPVWLVYVILPSLVPLVKVYKNMHHHNVAEQDIFEPNIFRTLLASNLPNSEKDYHRIAHDGFEIIAAGSSTFARVAFAGTYHILANRNVLLRLRDELDAAYPNNAQCTNTQELEALPYLNAVVKESLRIAQVVTFRTPLIATEDNLQYQSYHLPAGTAISMTQSAALMQSHIYPEPRRFHPERWLKPEEELKDMQRYHIPFGTGNRMCLGMNFAMANLYTFMATIFRRFELELVDTVRERDIDHSRSWFIGEPSAESAGMKIRVVKTMY